MFGKFNKIGKIVISGIAFACGAKLGYELYHIFSDTTDDFYKDLVDDDIFEEDDDMFEDDVNFFDGSKDNENNIKID